MNEIEIALSDCTELKQEFGKSLSAVMEVKNIEGGKRHSIERVSRFIQHVWESHTKAIVDVPCGGGKSLWSLAYIHWLIERSHRRPEQTPSLFLVVDTLATGKERLNALLDMGLGSDYIGFYHSFWQEECDGLRGGKGYDYRQLTSNRNLCRECPAKAACGYYNRYRELHRPVVILTHEGFIRLLEGDRFPTDREIIIDEEPNPYYMATFLRKDIEKLVTTLESIENPATELASVVATLNKLHLFASDTSNHLGTRKWTYHITAEERLATYHFLQKTMGGSMRVDDESGDPWVEEFLQEHNLTILGNLSYSLRDGAETYLYADNNKVSIARKRMDLGISNKVLLLNGSARLYRYSLSADMPVVTCPELKPDYPNAVIHCYEGLPTKKRMKNQDSMADYVEFAKNALGQQQVEFIALNKRVVACETSDPSTKDLSVEKRLREAYPTITDGGIGERGSIIGSNRWKECSVGVIAMSLFTDIAHYALHASLRHGREFHADEMFNRNGGKISLRVTKNSHLSPKEVDDEFRREAAHELYQTIMRLRCRQDAQAEIHVVVMIPYVELLADLERLMPNVRVRVNQRRGFDLIWELIRDSTPIKNEDWYLGLELNPTSGRNIDQARMIGGHFGVEPRKVDGNRVFWVQTDDLGIGKTR